ncbi:MAG TPA: GNAT family N-acetyltransferase [Gemmatimonadaceae bacterium]|nr:GNAT family N-acetyltransferase [Gemmatimonadaceae bacterium]
MATDTITIRAGDAPDVEAFLAVRIYEFNAAATGRADGEGFSATRLDADGAIVAGICGHTWAGSAYVSSLWVAASWRGQGTGAALLAAAESHARARHCRMVFVATHDFQAPAFYEHMGYARTAIVRDLPPGHDTFWYAKRL